MFHGEQPTCSDARSSLMRASPIIRQWGDSKCWDQLWQLPVIAGLCSCPPHHCQITSFKHPKMHNTLLCTAEVDELCTWSGWHLHCQPSIWERNLWLTIETSLQYQGKERSLPGQHFVHLKMQSLITNPTILYLLCIISFVSSWASTFPWTLF